MKFKKIMLRINLFLIKSSDVSEILESSLIVKETTAESRQILPSI